MNVSFRDKFATAIKIYMNLYRMPFRTAVKSYFKPAESTRYNEFAFLMKFLKDHPVKNSYILDISSPYAMAYLLSHNKNKVVKTDINSDERFAIKESDVLVFQKEDGTGLSFSDNTFDVVYSISVIEHIYQGYMQAVKEMIRVTKPGGIIYISTPLSAKLKEEWIDEDIYSDQFKETGKIFFQYRFSKNEIENLINSNGEAEVIESDIFWERHDGDYDSFIEKLKNIKSGGTLGFLQNSFLNMFVGSKILNNEPGNFNEAKSFGNISLIFKKK